MLRVEGVCKTHLVFGSSTGGPDDAGGFSIGLYCTIPLPSEKPLRSGLLEYCPANNLFDSPSFFYCRLQAGTRTPTRRRAAARLHDTIALLHHRLITPAR